MEKIAIVSLIVFCALLPSVQAARYVPKWKKQVNFFNFSSFTSGMRRSRAFWNRSRPAKSPRHKMSIHITFAMTMAKWNVCQVGLEICATCQNADQDAIHYKDIAIGQGSVSVNWVITEINATSAFPFRGASMGIAISRVSSAFATKDGMDSFAPIVSYCEKRSFCIILKKV